MRKLKRWWRRFYSEFRLRKRIQEITKELQSSLALDQPPVLKSAGSAGHDSIYSVFGSDGKQIGVLRVLNPWRERDFFAGDSPFLLTQPEERIEREWEVYQKGAGLNLTPQPLWRDKDALLCAYLPYVNFQKKLLDNPADAEMLMKHTARRICDLHRAGIIHMDANLSNILSDEDFNNIVFIDFEYKTAPHLSVAEQKLFDHLRALESVVKFIPQPVLESFIYKNDEGDWFHTLINSLSAEELKSIRLSVIAPGLERIFAYQKLHEAVQQRVG